MEQKCESCKFYVAPHEHPKWGLCHYNAPVVAKGKGQEPWPVVNDTDFCSKYEKRQEQKNKQSMTDEESKEIWDRHRSPS